MKRIMRVLVSIMPVLMFIGFVSGSTAAVANPKYASIVIDATTGEVLRESYADKKLYPASLTKMMTLYMTFEAIRDGRLTLDGRISVSRNAAAEPASKLGLRTGQKISVRDAIRACAVKSANDVATALGEAIGGTEQEFARMMTRRARELGMSSTTFKNANGLTDRGQRSTARDMALLGRRLMSDFPELSEVFSRKRFTYKGRNMRATNKLLSKYPGADGIKTGYTNASGYNLTATAEKNGDRIIAVVFGGRSSARRDSHVVRLLDDGFAKLARLQEKRSIAAAPVPRRKPVPGSAPQLVASAAPSSPTVNAARPSAIAAMRQSGDKATIQSSLEALQQALAPSTAQAATPSPAAPPTGVRTARSAPRAVGARQVSTLRQVAPSADGTWAVQIGAYRSRKDAERVLRNAWTSRRSNLYNAYPVVLERKTGGRPMYRARFSGLAKREAHSACRSLKRTGIECFAVASGS